MKVEGTARGQFGEPELGGDASFAVVDPLGDELVFVFKGRMGANGLVQIEGLAGTVSTCALR